MPNLTISIDSDEADQFMLTMLSNVGDTAIWCIREAHKTLANGGGSHNWSDIGDNLKILGAVNELLEYYGGKPLDLASHETKSYR
mgnify:CR=1 FL=1